MKNTLIATIVLLSSQVTLAMEDQLSGNKRSQPENSAQHALSINARDIDHNNHPDDDFDIIYEQDDTLLLVSAALLDLVKTPSPMTVPRSNTQSPIQATPVVLQTNPIVNVVPASVNTAPALAAAHINVALNNNNTHKQTSPRQRTPVARKICTHLKSKNQVCGESFASHNAFNKHILQKHHDVLQYSFICDYCNQKFNKNFVAYRDHRCARSNNNNNQRS